MQQLLTSKDSKDNRSHSSAFQPVSILPKSPADAGEKRDSGYGSDFSPAGLKSKSRRFTFDNDEVDSELCNALDEIDISADEDVFVDHFEPLFQVINECDENDETDREVEELFCNSPRGNLESQNVQINRPAAPLPTPTPEQVDISDMTHCVGGSRDICLIASPYYHTHWNRRDKYICRNPFHPTGSRSVGTQTPNPHCQLVQDALRSKKITLNRGRLRLQSEGEQIIQPLPDVVPMSRDRSISLPDVPSFQRLEHEQHVGRELRRISDDFHSVYLRRQRRRPRTRSEDPSASSRFPVDLPGYWNSLRRFVSSSPIFQAWSSEQR